MSELICLGDSITDCNRLFEDYPLGNGYVRMLAETLFLDSGSASPAKKKTASFKYDLNLSASASENSITQVRNYGVDGFTVARILDNVSHSRIPLSSASIVTLLIGINDIGLMMNTDRTKEQKQEMMQEFSVHYEQLLKLFIGKIYPAELSSKDHSRIILMEPFLFPYPDKYRLWLPYVKEMSEKIANLADKYKIPYIFLHDFFNEVARKQGYDAITCDGIHLTSYGHQLLADRIRPYALLSSQ